MGTLGTQAGDAERIRRRLVAMKMRGLSSYMAARAFLRAVYRIGSWGPLGGKLTRRTRFMVVRARWLRVTCDGLWIEKGDGPLWGAN